MKPNHTIFLETHNIKNSYSGFGQFNFNLAKALSQESDFMQNHKVLLNGVPKVMQKELGAALAYHTYWQISRYRPFRVRQKVSLWHAVNQNTKIEPYSNQIPYLLTVHDVNFIEEEEGKALEERIQRFRSKLNRCHALVYISKFAKRCTHQHFDVPKVPEYIIYNGNTLLDIDPNELPEINPRVIPKNPFLFSIGQVVAKKNFHTLVDMLPRLKNLDLVIAGSLKTDYATTLANKITELKLNNRVHLTGSISETEKLWYYKNCQAFTFPSLREGFGLPVLEAMTFGKPVFLSTKMALPEIGGNFAFYWEHFAPNYMANHLESSLRSYKSNQKQLEAAYKQHANKFTWKNAAKQYIKIYQEILSH